MKSTARRGRGPSAVVLSVMNSFATDFLEELPTPLADRELTCYYPVRGPVRQFCLTSSSCGNAKSVLNCFKCPFQGYNLEEMYAHGVKCHSGECVYTIPVDDQDISLFANNKYACWGCSSFFPSLRDVKIHVIKRDCPAYRKRVFYTEQKCSYLCPACRREIYSWSFMSRHLLNHWCKYSCMICNTLTADRLTMSVHLLHYHTKADFGNNVSIGRWGCDELKKRVVPVFRIVCDNEVMKELTRSLRIQNLDDMEIDYEGLYWYRCVALEKSVFLEVFGSQIQWPKFELNSSDDSAKFDLNVLDPVVKLERNFCTKI